MQVALNLLRIYFPDHIAHHLDIEEPLFVPLRFEPGKARSMQEVVSLHVVEFVLDQANVTEATEELDFEEK